MDRLDVADIFVCGSLIFMLLIDEHEDVDAVCVTEQHFAHQITMLTLTQHNVRGTVDFIPVDKKYLATGIALIDKCVHIAVRDSGGHFSEAVLRLLFKAASAGTQPQKDRVRILIKIIVYEF